MTAANHPRHGLDRRRTLQCVVAGLFLLLGSALLAGPAASQIEPVCTVDGTPGDDVLVGTQGDDRICGQGGNDVLRGLGGADELIGGDGNDVIEPGPGNDSAVGGIGQDTISYRDIPTTGASIDIAAGTTTGSNTGSDVFTGIERATGTPQNDTLTGSNDADWLTGLGGSDTLTALDGNDVLTPGTGDDGAGDGGDGIDVVRYNDVSRGGVTIDLAAGTAVGTLVGAGTAGSDSFDAVERAYGTRFADSLTGTAGPDVLWGAAGADILLGGDGDDTLLPGTGDDAAVTGGNGIDTVNYSDVDGAGATVDLVDGSASGTTIGNDTLSAVDNAVGTRFDDQLNGDAGPNRLVGLDGADEIDGRGGDDLVLPGTGADPGVAGGSGIDTVSYADLDGVTVRLADALGGTAVEPDVIVGFENVEGSPGDDALTGDVSANTISGLDGADDLQGGDGDNVLSGGPGDDELRSGTGNDALDGGTNTTTDPGDQCDPGSPGIGAGDSVVNCEGAFNIAPTAVDDGGLAFTTPEDFPFTTGDILANDTDPELAPLAIDSLVTTSTVGLATANADGTITYDPDGRFEYLDDTETTTDTIGYVVTDGNGGTDTGTVTITVTGVNDAPVAFDDGGTGFGTGAGTPFTTGSVLTNDTDPDVETLAVSDLDTTGTLGTVAGNGNGTFAYDPDGAFDGLADGATGSDTFGYTVSDGTTTDTATVTITITGVDDDPVAADDSGTGFATDEDNPFTTGSVLTNDTDPDPGDTVSVGMFDVTSAEGASVSSNGDGTFGYDPGDVFDGLALGESDTDTFTYQASDGNGVTDTATVTIAITGVNDAPSADADTDTTDEDTANAVDVLTGDTDPDTTDVLVVSAVDATGSNGGSITIDAGGTGVTYDPNGQFDALQVGDSATDTFQYTLSDGNGGTTTATVTMTITGVNDAPTAVDNSYGGVVGNTTAMIGTTSTGPTVALTGSVVRANDTDPDDATSSLTATLVATTTGADVTLNADGSFTYVPPAGVESTTDTFTYTVTDPAGLVSAPATVTLTITADVVWYVDASAAAGGDGRSTGPLQTVDALNTGTPDSLDDSFDYLAVYSGTYAGGITLETGQRLFGQPEGLVLGGNTLIAASGTKPVINGTTYGVTLAGAVDIRDVAVTASAGDGITGVGVDTFTIDAATTVTASGIELMLDGGNGTVTIPTTISSTVGGAVDIRNRTGGSITLTGPITVTGGKGVVSDNNDNSTVAFTGGMTVSSGGSVAFFAVNGGTVTATGTNSLISTSGTTLTVTDTTIGTAGLTFRSVSGSATNGILLSNTGAGTLTVTGDGASDTTNPTRGRTTAKAGGGTVAPGSGGTISGTLGTGISLTNTGPVVLRNMVVQNGSTSGLVATTVDGLTLDNTRISGHAFGSGMHLTSVTGYTVLHSELVGNATAESNRTPKTFNSEFDDTTGTATVTSSIFQNALEQVIQVNNTSGTLNLTMTNTLVTLAGGDGMRVIADGTGNITTTVQGSTFSSNSWGFSAYTQVAAASTQNVTLTGNTFTDGFLGVNISHGSSGTNSFNVSNNDFQRHQSVVINVNRLAGGTFTSFGLFSGTVQSNLIGAAGVVGSGSTGGDGIDVKTNGDGGTTRVAIRSNVIRRVSGQGIYAISRDTPTGHTLEMIIENNDIADLAPVGQDAIQIINGAVAGDVPTVCLDMSDNLATGVRFGLRLRPSGLPVATPTVLVAGWSGGPQTAQAYLEAQNTFSGGTGESSVSGTYQTTSGCTLP